MLVSNQNCVWLVRMKKKGSSTSSTKKKTNVKSRGSSKSATPVPEEPIVVAPPEEEFPDIPSDVSTVGSIRAENEDSSANQMVNGGSVKSFNRKEFFEQKSMREVHIGNKNLVHIPEVVFKYIELRVLWLNGNKMERFEKPLAYENLPNSDTLMLQNDMEYEKSFKQSERVKLLNRTKLSGLVLLTELYLHNNKLSTLEGSGIHLLKHLRILSLHTNSLSDISKVVTYLSPLEVEDLCLFDNPCYFEEGYKERVIEKFHKSLKILDRHELDEEDKRFIIEKLRPPTSKPVVFGKVFNTAEQPDKVNSISETVRDLEKRCKKIRKDRNDTRLKEERAEQEKMQADFRKTYEDSQPHEEMEENIYDTIRNRHCKENRASSNGSHPEPVSRRDFLRSFWTKEGLIPLS